MAPFLGACCCGLSLRTCAIVLTAINLVYALLDVTSTALLELVDLSRHPDEAFGEDLSRDADSAPHERAARDVSDAVTDHTLDETEEELRRFRDQYLALIYAVVIFSTVGLLLMIANVISLSVLMYGVARGKTCCVRQWLFIGGAVIVIDILNFLAYLCLEVDFFYALAPLFDTPLTSWLWLVTWSMYGWCKDRDKRNAETPLSMAALIEEGGDACTVEYDAMS